MTDERPHPEVEKRREVLGAIGLAVFLAALGLLLGILLFIIPGFKNMFEEMNLALPMPTQLLLAASDFFQGPIGWTLALSVLGAPIALFLLSSDRARLQPIF